MKFSIFYFLFSILLVSSFKFDNPYQNNINIRIENKSNVELSKISLFSVPFKNLIPNEKSSLKELNFNANSDDGMLFLTTKKLKFALYVVPITIKGDYTYQIDSLNLKNRYIYVTKLKK